MAQATAVKLLTAKDWKQQILDDIELQALDADVAVPPTAEGSHFDLMATADANALAMLTANQVLLDADSDPTRATGDALDELREAAGLPEITTQAASGYLQVGTTALNPLVTPDGMRILCPGALTAKSVGSQSGVITGSIIPFVMSTPGIQGNLKAGTKVRFTDPISGLNSDAVVTADMTDGTDAESDTRKRRRIMNRRQNAPAADNWGRLREVALSATTAVDNAFIYPALGGAGSCKTVLTAPWRNGGSGQTRVVTAQSIALVRALYEDNFSTDDALYHIESSVDEPVDTRILIRLQGSAAYWADATPWPTVNATISSVVSTTNFHITCASATTAPPVGTTVMIWSVADLAFRTAVLQTVYTVTSTEYAVTVAGWSGGALTSFTDGLYLGPACKNAKAYGDKALDVFGGLTPGEGCLTIQKPRSLRRPLESQDEPMAYGPQAFNQMISPFPEITSASIAYANKTAPTAVNPDTAPNVLVLRNLMFGVMP